MDSIFLGSELNGQADTIRASSWDGTACQQWKDVSKDMKLDKHLGET